MTPRKFFFILLSIFIVLVLAGAGSFYMLESKFEKKRTTLSELRARTTIAEKQLESLEVLNQQREEIERRHNQVNMILPQDKQQSEASAQIEAMFNVIGMELQAITFTDIEGLPSETTQTIKSRVAGVSTLPATISARGTYPQLISLLRLVEDNQRHMEVKSLTLISSGEGLINLTMVLDIYLEEP